MDQESNKKSGQAELKTMVCDSCGHKLTVKMPSKPDKYKFTCPHCQNTVSFVVKPEDSKSERKVLRADILDDSVISHRQPNEQIPGRPPQKDSATPPVQRGSSKADIPVLGTPVVPPGKHHYQLNEEALVNTQYRFGCPGCGKDIVIMPRVANKMIKVKCSKCGTEVVYKSVGQAGQAQNKVGKTPPPPMPIKATDPVVSPSQQPPAQQDDSGPATVCLPGSFGGGRGLSRGPMPHQGGMIGGPPGPPPLTPVISGAHNQPIVTLGKPSGMLSWKTGFMHRTKTHRLMTGRTTIGRYDPDKPSVVMISGDDEMSRQSVEINVIRRPDYPDYIYELKLLHSTNLVYVNNRPLAKGVTVQLNYGDTICMGRTIISFNKAND